MHILLWAPFGAGTHYWGPGTSAYRLYKNLNNPNVKITLIHASDYQRDFPDVYYEQIKLGSIDNRGKLSYFKYLIQSYKWIRLNHHKYDSVHFLTAYFLSFLPAVWFNKYNNNTFIKLTGVNGGFGANNFLSRLLGFKKFRLKYANDIGGYISISSSITDNLIENGVSREKIFYIPNGVDINRFYPVSQNEKCELRKELGVKDIFTACYIGGLTKNKNVIESVIAFHLLKENGVKAQLLIVGPDRSSGVEENIIAEYIKKNNLEDVCIRINHTDTPELYFRISNVFILNSKFEGLSNSLLEAMSSGLPCVAYPASGTVDLIENKVNGYLTDGTSDQIIKYINILIENEGKLTKMAKQARVTIKNGYSTEYVLQQHLRLFRREKGE